MPIPKRIEEAAKNRIAIAADAIARSVYEIQNGFPLRAEPVQERRIERIAAAAPADACRVEIGSEVARVFADDLSGAKHQQFTVVPNNIVEADDCAAEDVRNAIDESLEVRLAVRFGDSMGLADRIQGIRTGVALQIKGEWIPESAAFSVGGERMAVLHFRHDPLGFICTPVECFS